MNQPQAKAFPVSWDQFHRDCKALAWRLAGIGDAKGEWKAVISITRGGLVPAAIIARELGVQKHRDRLHCLLSQIPGPGKTRGYQGHFPGAH